MPCLLYTVLNPHFKAKAVDLADDHGLFITDGVLPCGLGNRKGNVSTLYGLLLDVHTRTELGTYSKYTHHNASV